MDGASEKPEDSSESGLLRLLIAACGFVAFEALFIATLGESIYDFSYFSLGLWGLIALAGAGYLGLGIFSRSWLSALVLVAPLAIAAYFVNVIWTEEFESIIVGKNANFTQIWLALSLIFVPAWAFGVLHGKKRR